ncbi:hypothetical protein MA16_Dca008446 [Dendrobium catenatum]|uniref:Uncharacterized protein n=1 Tax=Dendrobium catenatum TaxID=906689 RepID=A0A2I0VMB6_9ASPA|nr:hypothetical protein MA16_Dca008446 [Dendrobium catenatum]
MRIRTRHITSDPVHRGDVVRPDSPPNDPDTASLFAINSGHLPIADVPDGVIESSCL